MNNQEDFTSENELGELNCSIQINSILESFFKDSTLNMLIIDSGYKVLQINNSACALFKKYFNIMINVNEKICDYTFFEKTFKPDFIQVLKKKKHDRVVKINHSVFSDIYLDTSYSVKNSNNKKIILLTVRDISKQKTVEDRLQKSRANLKAMLDAAPQYYLLISDTYKILSYNKTTEIYYNKFTGKNIGIGDFFLDYLDEESIPKFKKNVNKCLEGEIIQSTNEYNAHGNALFLESTYSPVFDANNQSFAVAINALDITHQRHTEDELRKREQKLQELNSKKDKFFAIIAHDLKNPFNGVANVSELLIKNIQKYDKAKIKRFLEMIFDTSIQGYNLLKNLTEWSNAQEGSLKQNPELINIQNIVNENIDLLKNNAINKDISLKSEVAEDIIAIADKNMINTVFRNLISNAIKYTREKGTIKIKAQDYRKQIIISITDTGIGINQADIPKLFQIDTMHRKIAPAENKGTGIGLILCREFIEKNGGKIWVESSIGKGSTFSFSLPGIAK